jgi:hypothetical protein
MSFQKKLAATNRSPAMTKLLPNLVIIPNLGTIASRKFNISEECTYFFVVPMIESQFVTIPKPGLLI